MGGREVPTTDDPCDRCKTTERPVFDFMGDNLCSDCAYPANFILPSRQEVDELRAELAAAQSKRDDHKAEYDNAKQVNAQLRSALKTAQEEVETLGFRMDEKESDIASLSGHLEREQDRHAVTQGELFDWRSNAVKWHEQRDAWREAAEAAVQLLLVHPDRATNEEWKRWEQALKATRALSGEG